MKLLEAINTLLVGYIFLKYTTIEYLSVESIFYISIAIIVSIIQKNKLKLLFTQEKEFYKYRLGTGVIGWIGFIIGLYIYNGKFLSINSYIIIIYMISISNFFNETYFKR